MTRHEQNATGFRALNAAEPLVPNPWDAGSARMLDALGFGALATTSVRMLEGPSSIEVR